MLLVLLVLVVLVVLVLVLVLVLLLLQAAVAIRCARLGMPTARRIPGGAATGHALFKSGELQRLP